MGGLPPSLTRRPRSGTPTSPRRQKHVPSWRPRGCPGSPLAKGASGPSWPVPKSPAAPHPEVAVAPPALAMHSALTALQGGQWDSLGPAELGGHTGHRPAQRPGSCQRARVVATLPSHPDTRRPLTFHVHLSTGPSRFRGCPLLLRATPGGQLGGRRGQAVAEGSTASP